MIMRGGGNAVKKIPGKHKTLVSCPTRALIKPAITYFRVIHTIMGPKCLTAVFGMGTGVATWVWSPASRGTREKGPGARKPQAATLSSKYQKGSGSELSPYAILVSSCGHSHRACDGWLAAILLAPRPSSRAPHCKERINAVKQLAVSTG